MELCSICYDDVRVFSPNGTYVGQISMPFRQRLFMTGSTSFEAVDVETRGLIAG